MCHRLGQASLADGPRSTTLSPAQRTPTTRRRSSARRPRAVLAEWSNRLAALDDPWAPAQDTLQADTTSGSASTAGLAQPGERELASLSAQFDVEVTRLDLVAAELAVLTLEIHTELGRYRDRILTP
ncbi:hypothetical protein ABZY09_35860 [Streptomyces sp. NPDC002928]|uniref:hypothetical protein n=1 Tax=Streptomyces sp. NPDC002928 TaxID=3154440 RepID=UPI0033B9CAE5